MHILKSHCGICVDVRRQQPMMQHGDVQESTDCSNVTVVMLSFQVPAVLLMIKQIKPTL